MEYFFNVNGKKREGGTSIPPLTHQAELFTHTTVNGKKLATSKFQSRWGGARGKCQELFFLALPIVTYIDHLTVIDLNKSNTPTKSGFWLLSALFLLQGADNEGGFWLISAFFLLQGAGD